VLAAELLADCPSPSDAEAPRKIKNAKVFATNLSDINFQTSEKCSLSPMASRKLHYESRVRLAELSSQGN
jgi:hypothetical protein